MSQQRFFVSPGQIDGRRITFSGEQARQIYRVLRMREDEILTVLDNTGWQYEVRLNKVTSDLVTAEIESRERAAGEPQTRLTLYQAMLKKDNFEWIVQKGTELGVTRFVPLITQHCVVRDETIKPAKRRRWQRILTEAAEQSGRARLPELSEPVSLNDALDEVGRFDLAAMPWENEAVNTLPGVIAARSPLPSPATIALFIGPEGGWSLEEVQMARASGLLPVTLGPRILRAETAAIVAAALALAALGDLEGGKA